jgi:ABC-2 type transport system ATP-binding protein
MRRRLDLAASLITRPAVLFLDEPTTGLDPHSRNQIWETVRALKAEGTTVLLTTQYLEEADQLADDIALVDRGRVAHSGTPAELKALIGSYAEAVVADADAMAGAAAVLDQLTGSRPDFDRSGTPSARSPPTRRSPSPASYANSTPPGCRCST